MHHRLRRIQPAAGALERQDRRQLLCRLWPAAFRYCRHGRLDPLQMARYVITNIRAVADRPDPKGGPSHCEKVLDAAGEAK